MTAYQQSLYGFINSTIVLVSKLVQKTTMKQLVISVPYVLSEILISEVFDSIWLHFQKSASYYLQRSTAYFRAIKEWKLYNLVAWDISDVCHPVRSKWILLKLQG